MGGTVLTLGVLTGWHFALKSQITQQSSGSKKVGAPFPSCDGVSEGRPSRAL